MALVGQDSKYGIVGVVRGNAWCVLRHRNAALACPPRMVRSFRFRVAVQFQMSDLLCMVVNAVCAANATYMDYCVELPSVGT